MRILLTGCTSRQCNIISDKSNYYRTNIQALYRMLISLGHDVLWRFYYFDLKLKDFDLVIVCLSPPSSITSCFLYNALLALEHENVMLYFNDWNIRSIYNKSDSIFRRFVLNTQTLEIPSKYHKKIEYNYNRLFTEDFKCLFPTFEWGAHDILKNSYIKTFYTIDPSLFIDKFLPLTHDKSVKERAWVLSNLRLYQIPRRKWKIYQFSNDNFINENSLTEYYNKCYGNICVDQYHVGSGWWRCRYLISVYTKSVMYCNFIDGSAIGTDFTYNLEEIEQMTNEELLKVAESQSDQFLSCLKSKEYNLQKLQKIISK